MKYRFIILTTFACSTLFFAHYVFSQTTSPSSTFDISSLIDKNTGLPVGIDEQLSIEQIPEVPKPGETVSIRINGYTTNLNKAKITWIQDGKVILSAMGAVVNQVQAPASGKSSTIVISIAKETGGVISKTITLNPADVDLFYEAHTYAHPFYKGKKQYTSESVITFIAVPNFVNSNGTKIPDTSLVYKWSINGSVIEGVSGYGRNTFTTKGQLIERPAQVTVEVSAVGSNLIATQTTNFKSTTPEIIAYENNPILGVVYDKAVLGDFLLERPQVDFEGIPYFFSTETKNSPSLKYTWSINGIVVTSKIPTENYLLLRNDKNTDGYASISVTVEHVENLLQNGTTQLGLNFKKVNNTSNEATSF
jgi:hypothetical protein